MSESGNEKADLVRPKMLQKFSSCDTSVHILSVHGRNMETATLACQKRGSFSSSASCENSSFERNARR